MPAKKTAKAAKSARASKKQAAADAEPQATDQSTDETVGGYQLNDGTTVVDVVCPKGHPSGKGHVATGQLGKATCGTCGSILTAAKNSAKTKAKHAKEGKGSTVDADEPPPGPGIPKVAPDADFAKTKGDRAAKARKGAGGKVDSKGGPGVTVRDDPS